MRGTLIAGLIDLAEVDERVVLLTGDLGFMVIEPFASRFPDRFINVGVAEANMLGLAAGMAKQGLVPFCYSIATFASTRGYEQLRNGAVLHRLPVRVVGVGGGFAYGTAGPTHWALEDIAIMRVQPGMTVVAPGGDEQMGAALLATYDLPGPVYYRVGKDSVTVRGLGSRFRLNRCETLVAGSRVALFTTGAMTAETMRTADLLVDHGVHPTVVQVPCLAPAPVDDITEVVAHHTAAITIEDHYRTGGLGSIVAEAIAESGLACRLVRVGIDGDLSRSGSERWLRAQHGLTAETLHELVVRLSEPEHAVA